MPIARNPKIPLRYVLEREREQAGASAFLLSTLTDSGMEQLEGIIRSEEYPKPIDRIDAMLELGLLGALNFQDSEGNAVVLDRSNFREALHRVDRVELANAFAAHNSVGSAEKKAPESPQP